MTVSVSRRVEVVIGIPHAVSRRDEVLEVLRCGHENRLAHVAGRLGLLEELLTVTRIV